MTSAPPKVFVSYSHDSVEHQDRVLAFADRLRVDGIDAEIDQYNAAPSETWAFWCERQIEAADVVLMVCTETYFRRVSGKEQRGMGLGVVWEARIIRQLLYDSGAVGDKFVPILFSDGLAEQIPIPIKGGTHYVVDTETGYEELYRRLTAQPRLLRPILGSIRSLGPRNRRSSAEAETLAASLAGSFMLPFIRKGEKKAPRVVGEKAGPDTVSPMERIWDRVGEAFNEPDEEAALRLFKNDPESAKPLIESILKKKLAKDSFLFQQLAELVRPQAASGVHIEKLGYVDARRAQISGGVVAGIVEQRDPAPKSPGPD